MPLLDDARALLEIDRERVRLARETAQIALEHSEVLADAEDRAQRLAALGDRERPKAEGFAQRMAEAATLLPRGGLAGNGEGGGAATRASGGGGAAGGTGGGGARISGARALVSQRGGISQAEDFVRERCSLIPGGVEVPNPGNINALAQGDMVTVPAWDCSVALGVPDAIFLDPDAMQALRAPARSSSHGGGGKSGGTPRDRIIRGGILGETGVPVNPFKDARGGSVVGGGPAAGPTADGKLVERTLKDGFSMLAKELRAGGDLGLQIRRNGGL